jgi:hypothetical protein
VWFLSLGAAVVSGVFAALLAGQWSKRHRPHLLAWAMALAMFTLASLAPAVGMLDRWTPTWFRIYYLFGAIVNVPVLGLGTIYLLGSRRLGHAVAIGVLVISMWSVVAVWRADIVPSALRTEGIPKASKTMPGSVRTLARVLSFAGFLVVSGGAVWSAAKLARGGQEHLRRLALANGLIAAGTIVVALGSSFAVYGRGLPFALGLFVGVSLMFWGFLQTRASSSLRAG